MQVTSHTNVIYASHFTYERYICKVTGHFHLILNGLLSEKLVLFESFLICGGPRMKIMNT